MRHDVQHQEYNPVLAPPFAQQPRPQSRHTLRPVIARAARCNCPSLARHASSRAHTYTHTFLRPPHQITTTNGVVSPCTPPRHPKDKIGGNSKSVVSYLEVQGNVAEPQVLRGHEACEEDVDPLSNAEGHGHDAVGRGSAVQAADVVRQVVQDGQIVLHDENEAFCCRARGGRQEDGRGVGQLR